MGFLCPAGTRERLLGDPNFPIKVAIEVGIGITMKILAELNKRGDNFKAEIDFVFANCVMAVVADFMLTWLPAPRYTFGQSKAAAAATKPQSGLQKWFAGCPDNAFQVSILQEGRMSIPWNVRLVNGSYWHAATPQEASAGASVLQMSC